MTLTTIMAHMVCLTPGFYVCIHAWCGWDVTAMEVSWWYFVVNWVIMSWEWFNWAIIIKYFFLTVVSYHHGVWGMTQWWYIQKNILIKKTYVLPGTPGILCKSCSFSFSWWCGSKYWTGSAGWYNDPNVYQNVWISIELNGY